MENPPLLSLDGQLALYKQYHMNPTNVKIHLVCIPQIFLTYLLMASYVTISDASPFFNLCWVGIAIYGSYYIALDTEAGLIAAPILLAIGLFSNHLVKSNAVLLGLQLVNLAAWSAQFYGHFHFEGNAPAVFDNLVQPLVLAPFFVLFEVMFALGHRTDLYKKILREAKVNLDVQRKREREAKAAKAANAVDEKVAESS